MIELSFEYWNKLAEQLTLVSALLSGFSITVLAGLLVYNVDTKLMRYIFKSSILASVSFLVSLFSAIKIGLMTTEGYPLKVDASAINFPRIIGAIAFLLGVFSLCTLISLSGWTKSRQTGLFSTILGILAFILMIASV